MLGSVLTSNPLNVVVLSFEDAVDCMNHVPDLTRVKVFAIDETTERVKRIYSSLDARRFYNKEG